MKKGYRGTFKRPMQDQGVKFTPTLKEILEDLDSRLADFIDKLEEITPDLEEDSDAFIADDIKYALEDIRGVINEDN